MTPAISKVIFVGLVIVWYLIRYEYARRSRREKVVSTARGPLETALLLISLLGLGLVPLLYVATGIPRFAAYSFYPSLASLGACPCDCGFDSPCIRSELINWHSTCGKT